MNLHSDILDTPEWFWEADLWEPRCVFVLMSLLLGWGSLDVFVSLCICRSATGLGVRWLDGG